MLGEVVLPATVYLGELVPPGVSFVAGAQSGQAMLYLRELVLPEVLFVGCVVGEVFDFGIRREGEAGSLSEGLFLFEHDLPGIQVPHLIEVKDSLCSFPGVGLPPIWPGTLESIVPTYEVFLFHGRCRHRSLVPNRSASHWL